MTNFEIALVESKQAIEKWTRFLIWLEKHAKQINSLPFEPNIWNGQCDYNDLSHENILKVMAVFSAGKWTKEPIGFAKINYITEVDGVVVRCWMGEPPPSCKLVEYEETIPAQPERIEKRFKMVCKEAEAQPA